MYTLRIATRRSPLALWQAEHIKAKLLTLQPDLTIELVPIVTQGDKILHINLAKIGGKGLFVKELEQALLTNKADLAVHSMKDVPVQFPEGLTLAVVDQRENPTDALVSRKSDVAQTFTAGAVIGTSSLRRQCQILAHYPDCTIKNLRGNVQTRLSKLDNGEYDAIILASAGLIRSELDHRITHEFSVEDMLPGCGQGALGIEYREDDDRVAALVKALIDPDTQHCVSAERAMNRRLGASCQVPIASHAIKTSTNEVWLRGLVACPQTNHCHRAEARGGLDQLESMGTQVAEALLAQGADQVLAQLGIELP